MSFNSFKCPSCGANLKINKINKIGKCLYCGYEVSYDLPDTEFTRLIQSAEAHTRLNDMSVLKRDCSLLYERYPGNPATYYYLAKADLMEISMLINNKDYAPRCNYLLSCVYGNLLRLKEFNKDNDINPTEIVNQYNEYITKNNKDMNCMAWKIRIYNAILVSVVVLFAILIIALCCFSYLFLGLVLILIGLGTKFPYKIIKNLRRLPSRRKNPEFV